MEILEETIVYTDSEGRFVLEIMDFRIMSDYVLNGRDVPGGAVVKSPPASAEDMGSSPGPGRSHMLWSN